MNNIEFENSVLNIYNNSKRPLYLAKLGSELNKLGIHTPNLKQAILNTQKFITVEHPTIKEKIAVSLKSEVHEVTQIFSTSEDRAESNTLSFLKKFKRSFLIAFCQKEKIRESIHIENTFPFKYSTTPKDNTSEISEKFFVNAQVPFYLNSISNSDAATLASTIREWAKENEIDLSIFYHLTGEKESNKTTKSALDILLEAIPNNRLTSINIPLDIIMILNEKKL